MPAPQLGLALLQRLLRFLEVLLPLGLLAPAGAQVALGLLALPQDLVLRLEHGPALELLGLASRRADGLVDALLHGLVSLFCFAAISRIIALAE